MSDNGKKHIKQARDKYIRVLYKYIKHKHGDALVAGQRISHFLLILNPLTVKLLFQFKNEF